MKAFFDYINNAVLKFLIYFTPHMHIIKQIMDIILKWFDVFIQNRCVNKQ